MKYVVGLFYSSFGVFWVVEGIGYFSATSVSLVWPGEVFALGVILLAWFIVSRLLVFVLRNAMREKSGGAVVTKGVAS